MFSHSHDQRVSIALTEPMGLNLMVLKTVRNATCFCLC